MYGYSERVYNHIIEILEKSKSLPHLIVLLDRLYTSLKQIEEIIIILQKVNLLYLLFDIVFWYGNK